MKRLVLAAALFASVALYAQQPGFSRKMLQDHNLSVSDRHAVQALAEFVPGGSAGNDSHPGEELGYVLEGTPEPEIAGEGPRTVNAGHAFLAPGRGVHDAQHVDSG